MKFPLNKTMNQQSGFSLLEVAVVLVILGLLIGSLVTPLSAQRENKQRGKVTTTLQEIKASLIGFMLVNGRLPCPASAASNGLEVRNGSGVCTTANGFVPNVTLGISGKTTSVNLLSDPWTYPYRYSLSDVNAWEYANAIRISGTSGNLQVCSAVSCNAAEEFTSNAVVVLFSTGKYGVPTPSSSLETENTDADTLFISTDVSEAVGSEYDDEMIWISQNEIVYALMQGGYSN